MAHFVRVWPVSNVQELFIHAQLIQRCMYSFLTRHQHVTWRWLLVLWVFPGFYIIFMLPVVIIFVETSNKYKSNFDEVDVTPAKNWNKVTKLTKWKSDKINCKIKYKPHAHLPTIEEDVQICIKIGMKLYKELRLQGIHCLCTFIESEVKNDKVHKVEKMTKINARIISKPHAHL